MTSTASAPAHGDWSLARTLSGSLASWHSLLGGQRATAGLGEDFLAFPREESTVATSRLCSKVGSSRDHANQVITTPSQAQLRQVDDQSLFVASPDALPIQVDWHILSMTHLTCYSLPMLPQCRLHWLFAACRLCANTSFSRAIAQLSSQLIRHARMSCSLAHSTTASESTPCPRSFYDAQTYANHRATSSWRYTMRHHAATSLLTQNCTTGAPGTA